MTTVPSVGIEMEFVNTDDTPISFECAVVIYPPAGRQHRNMFKLLMMSELESILTGVPPLTDGTSGRRRVNIGSETKKVTWPERGWRRREDWQDEMEQGLNDGESSVSGVVVARRLTKQEAETLVGQLLARAKQVSKDVDDWIRPVKRNRNRLFFSTTRSECICYFSVTG